MSAPGGGDRSIAVEVAGRDRTAELRRLYRLAGSASPRVLFGARRLLLLATYEQVPCGLAALRHSASRAPGDRTGVIEVLYVEEGFRGLGVGEALLGALRDQARTHRLAELEIEARPGDRELKAALERDGFKTARLLLRSPIDE